MQKVFFKVKLHLVQDFLITANTLFALFMGVGFILTGHIMHSEWSFGCNKMESGAKSWFWAVFPPKSWSRRKKREKSRKWIFHWFFPLLMVWYSKPNRKWCLAYFFILVDTKNTAKMKFFHKMITLPENFVHF